MHGLVGRPFATAVAILLKATGSRVSHSQPYAQNHRSCLLTATLKLFGTIVIANATHGQLFDRPVQSLLAKCHCFFLRCSRSRMGRVGVAVAVRCSALHCGAMYAVLLVRPDLWLAVRLLSIDKHGDAAAAAQPPSHHGACHCPCRSLHATLICTHCAVLILTPRSQLHPDHRQQKQTPAAAHSAALRRSDFFLLLTRSVSTQLHSRRHDDHSEDRRYRGGGAIQRGIAHRDG